MHSTFNLLPGTDEAVFRGAFSAFCEHLVAQDLITAWRIMRRQAHSGYNADEPAGSYYLMTEFADMTQAQACWDYVQADAAPIDRLHRKVREQVTDSSFYLAEDF